MATSKKSGRPRLIAAREQRGLSQEQAAARAGVASITWARWEWGETTPHRRQLSSVAAAFKVSLPEVRRWFDVEDTGRKADVAAPWLAGQLVQSSLAATVEGAQELWRQDVDPTRRTLLSALPFLPSVVSEWLLSYTLDPGLEVQSRDARGVRVGMEDVQQVRDAVDAFTVMDHMFGGGLVRPAIIDFLHTRVGPLLRGTYTEEVGSQLLAAAAVMTGLAGWEAYDLAQHGLAQAHFGQALRLAKAAGDPLTAALMLTTLAQQSIDLHHPGHAVRLARAAQLAAQEAGACARVRAALLIREARATALVVHLSDTPDPHTASRAERLVGRAHETFASIAPGDDEPHWTQDLDEAELTAEAGCVWHLIGHHEQAAGNAEHALGSFDPGRVRSRQFNLVHRAQALAGLGDLDTAITVARQALPIVSGLQSARSVALIKSFDRQLDPHATEPRVRQWRDHLRDALPAAV